jgi:hypothetical protein
LNIAQSLGRPLAATPALSHVVEHRNPVRQLGGVMIRKQEAPGGEAHVARLHKRLRDQQIGRGVRLPWRGMVLADPALSEPEFVGPAQGLQVPVMSVIEAALRRV